MQEPAVLERARAVLKHAAYLGAPLHQFCVSVAVPEAFELLDWYAETANPDFCDVDALKDAIREAHTTGDPFDVLKDLRLLGLEVVRAQ